MVPTALVRPSLNTSLWSQCRYSGVLMKRKWTEALSPVRKQSLFIDKMVAVCLMLPQWTEWKVRTEKVNGYRETKRRGENQFHHLKRKFYLKSWLKLILFNNLFFFQTSWVFSMSLLPTHGLVSGRYRSGMMQYQNLSLKLPCGLWAQPWRNHHHAFSYGRTLDLYKEPWDEGKDKRGPRQEQRNVSF